jgi:hypothetical protein
MHVAPRALPFKPGTYIVIYGQHICSTKFQGSHWYATRDVRHASLVTLRTVISDTFAGMPAGSPAGYRSTPGSSSLGFCSNLQS